MGSLPFTSANGNITVRTVDQANVFGYDVWLLLNGAASVIPPADPAHPEADRPQYPALDTYKGLVRHASSSGIEPLSVSVGPRELAQLVAGRNVPLVRLTDAYISPVGDKTWEFVIPASPGNPELIVYVNPDWEGTTTAGNRNRS